MKLNWQPKALKQLSKFKDKAVITRVTKSVQKLIGFPNVPNVKALSSHEYQYQYRLRVGDYRVFFNVDDVIEIISIEEVKKRDERTY